MAINNTTTAVKPAVLPNKPAIMGGQAIQNPLMKPAIAGGNVGLNADGMTKPLTAPTLGKTEAPSDSLNIGATNMGGAAGTPLPNNLGAGGGSVIGQQSPVMGGNNMTPGGLTGNIRPNPYSPATPPRPTIGDGGDGSMSSGGSWSRGRPYHAGRQNPDSLGGFDEFRDSALAQAMRTLNPQIEQGNSRFEQMMLSRGIQPGTEQYNINRELMDRRNNDMLAQAAYGAQQQGLSAQNQAFNQGYQYDALANALNQSQIAAHASMANARTGANASMHNAGLGAQASMYGADLSHGLGMNQLNEQARLNDLNDIFRNQQLDLQGAMGFGGLDLQQQQQNLAAWQAQQNANNQWWNQIGGFTANAPGVMFNPTGDVAGSMQNAGQNMANAQAQQNQMLGSLAGGLMGFSDKRLKENIELVGNVDGINVYEFDYIDKRLGEDRYRGVMAQEIAEDYPEAIIPYGDYLMVNYSKLPVNMEVV